MKKKVCVVGAGRWGMNHIRTLDDLSALGAVVESNLGKHKKIKTTHARAKELQRFLEPLITFAKRGDLHARRQVLRKIKHKEMDDDNENKRAYYS